MKNIRRYFQRLRRERAKERNPTPFWYVVWLLMGPAAGVGAAYLLSKYYPDAGGSPEFNKVAFGIVGGMISLYFTTIKAFHEMFSKMMHDQLRRSMDHLSLAQSLQKIPNDIDPTRVLESVRNLATFVNAACNEYRDANLAQSALMISSFKTQDLLRVFEHGKGIDCTSGHYTKVFAELAKTMTDFLYIDPFPAANSAEFNDYLKSLEQNPAKKEYILCCDRQRIRDARSRLITQNAYLKGVGFETYWTDRQAIVDLREDYSKGFHHIFDRKITFTLNIARGQDTNRPLGELRKDLVIAAVRTSSDFGIWLDRCVNSRKSLSEAIAAE